MADEEKPKRQTRRRRKRTIKGKMSLKKSVKKFCESQGCIPNGNPCQCAHLLMFLKEKKQ